MDKNRSPILKRCKTLGISPTVLGVFKETTRNPKPKRKKQSEYGLQLNEKQKVKFIYGVSEKQFKGYYTKSEKLQGLTGTLILEFLELRLDSIAYRLNFASTRRESRQLVGHGHFTVNGLKVDIPSYIVKVGDVIGVCEKSRQSTKFKALMETKGGNGTPSWLSKEKDSFEGKVMAKPVRTELDFEVEEHLIVELYSK